MSEPVNPKLPEVAEALANGRGEFEEVSGDAGYDGESDEYDIDEEEGQYEGEDDEDDEDEDEGNTDNKDVKKGDGLTALLLGDPSAVEEEEEEEEISDEEYTEDHVPATPGTKKRTIDQVNDRDLGDESEAKKVKA